MSSRRQTSVVPQQGLDDIKERHVGGTLTTTLHSKPWNFAVLMLFSSYLRSVNIVLRNYDFVSKAFLSTVPKPTDKQTSQLTHVTFTFYYIIVTCYSNCVT